MRKKYSVKKITIMEKKSSNIKSIMKQAYPLRLYPKLGTANVVINLAGTLASDLLATSLILSLACGVLGVVPDGSFTDELPNCVWPKLALANNRKSCWKLASVTSCCAVIWCRVAIKLVVTNSNFFSSFSIFGSSVKPEISGSCDCCTLSKDTWLGGPV